jgi:hypothetical protein
MAMAAGLSRPESMPVPIEPGTTTGPASIEVEWAFRG